ASWLRRTSPLPLQGAAARTDEAYTVAVKVADDEVSSALRLLLELLVERRSRRDVLGVERFHILDLDEGGNESIPVLRTHDEYGLVDEFQMYTRTVARHGAIERWFPMQEVDRETERVFEKLGGRHNVGNEDHRHGARQSRCRRHRLGLRGLP